MVGVKKSRKSQREPKPSLRLPRTLTGVAARCGRTLDGRSSSLTAPSGQAQQGLLVAALADAGVAADMHMQSEAHGTGTALGDPIEAGSLAGAVVRRREGESGPLAVGGVKANLGHAEA